MNNIEAVILNDPNFDPYGGMKDRREHASALARQIDALYPKKEGIEARERERVLRYLKGLLGANPNASLAATIDVIETEGKSLEALKGKTK